MCHMPCSRATNGASAWWSPTSGSAMVEINGCEVGGRGIESRRRQHLLTVLINSKSSNPQFSSKNRRFTDRLSVSSIFLRATVTFQNQCMEYFENREVSECILRLVTDGYMALILRTPQPGFFPLSNFVL
jgi:hypothetical protein